METEEKAKLEEEIRAKQEEIEDIKNTVAAKEEESKKLQDEVDLSRRQLEESAKALFEANKAKEEEEKIVENGTQSTLSSQESLEMEEMTAKSVDIPEIIVDPVEEREIEMDADMTQEMKGLSEELAEHRSEENATEETKSFRE